MNRLYAYDTSEEEYKANITIPKNHSNIASADSRDLNYPVETGRFQKIFEVQETLGEGGFGQVYKAIHRLDKDVYAVKKVAIREPNSNKLNTTIERMLREVSTMKKLNHKSIVRYITCWIEECQNEELSEEHENIERVVSRKNYKSKVISNDSDGCSYFAFDKSEKNSQDDSEQPRKSESLESRDKEKLKPKSLEICLFIQLEYCAGMTLRNFISRPKSERPVATMAEMFYEIVDGVNAFHKAGIFHRDLKPENIFLHGNESLKIGDFGLAVNHIERSKEHNDQIHLTHKIGTRFYMSPEMKFNLDYNYKTDIYALGIIFYEMLLELGSAHERSEVLTKLGSKDISEGFKKEFPDESKLILRMVDHVPEKRPDAGQIIAELLKIKNCYSSRKFKEDQAEVIGYNDNIAENPPPLIESLFVKNSKGIPFSIRQGLKGDVANNPPSIGKIITFKYETVDPKGVPFNPIYKGYDIKPKKLEEPVPLPMQKHQDSDEKFIEEQAEVIGYDGTMMDNPPPIIESLLVQNSKGVFKIIQGLRGKVRSAPPSKGQIITFKYETTDSKGQPANAIYIKK